MRIQQPHYPFELISIQLIFNQVSILDSLAHDHAVQFLRSKADLGAHLFDAGLVLFLGRVIVVLDVVVRSSADVLANFRPLVAQLAVQLKNQHFLLLRDRAFANRGIQVVIPSLTTLLAAPVIDEKARFEHKRNQRPRPHAVLVYQVDNCLVFLSKVSTNLLQAAIVASVCK